MLNRKQISYVSKLFLVALVSAALIFLLFGSQYSDLFNNLQNLTFNVAGVKISIWFLLKGIITFITLLSLASIFLEKVETKINSTNYINNSKKTLIIKGVQILTYTIVFIVSLDILSLDLATFTIFSGAIGIGIGFGLQKVASNFISGLILLSEKSIEGNDLIELSDGTMGYVRYTGARYTLLRTETGIEVIIPNDELLANRVINWTYSDTKAALNIEIKIDYESNTEDALLLMKNSALEHQLVLETPSPSAYIKNVHYDAVALSLTFWLSNITEGRDMIKTQLFSNIISQFKDHNINVAKLDHSKYDLPEKVEMVRAV
ncbi:MAG: mechanosensitive ion channel [Alphaproteobacteria bacterium]|jgi:small-conductance mechanosensitive channel|nr:mechanosensitive ion channel [Alphaproteobacteria bacterium]MBT5390542.1 mechanosensitive ion channel [Alphaproteobacteria bacterium]